MAKQKLNIIVKSYPKRRFENEFKEYGKHASALAEKVNKKSTTTSIHIKNGKSSKQFKKVMEHEVGHAIIDKTQMCNKFSNKEKQNIRELAKQLYGKNREYNKEKPKEQLMEGLAWIYQRSKSGTPTEKKIMRTEYSKAYDEFKKAKQKLNIKIMKRRIK